MKTYSELIEIKSFEDRLLYLQTFSKVGEQTFGGHRWMNQMLYKDPEWKRIRRKVILRDSSKTAILDLGHPDYPIFDGPIVHHINPITIDDVMEKRRCVFDLDNLICCSFMTHQYIHYGTKIDMKSRQPAIRTPNDTCPWKT